jgi:hypothetical protein
MPEAERMQIKSLRTFGPFLWAGAPAYGMNFAQSQYAEPDFPAKPDGSQDRIDEKCRLLSLPFQFNFPSEVELEIYLRCERVCITGNMDIPCKAMIVPNSDPTLHSI